VIAQALRRFEPAADFAPTFRDTLTRPGGGLPIAIRGLEKSFGTNAVLRGIDLDVPAGEFVAIVGRSGCGKSTLLRLLLGLDRPSGGTFGFGEHVYARPGPSDIRVMFQEPRLLPWASVLANVEVGLGEERGSPLEHFQEKWAPVFRKKMRPNVNAREQALATLREVGLFERRNDWPSILSGGQRQRVALARALVSRPRVLAFDEPLGALDALTRISMQTLLERVWHDQRFTAIMVTHDVAEAVTLADRVLMIEDGRIALDLRVDLPRPRQRGSAEVAALEGTILRDLFRNAALGEDV
jgi:sulfonate transport system ATP-binding protein